MLSHNMGAKCLHIIIAILTWQGELMTFVPTHTHYTQTFLSNISVALSSAHSNQKQKRMAYQVIIGACKQCKMQVQTIFHILIWVFIFFQWNNIWNIFPKSTLTVFIPVLWWRLLFTWSIKHDIAKHNRKGNWKDYNIIVNVLKVGKKNHPQKNPKYGLVRKDLEEMYEVGLNRKWRCAQFESPPQQHGDCFR